MDRLPRDETHRSFARLLIVHAPLLALVLGVIQWFERDEWIAFALLEAFLIGCTGLAYAELQGWLSTRRRHRTQRFVRSAGASTVRWRPSRGGAWFLLACGSLLFLPLVFLAIRSPSWPAVTLSVLGVAVLYVFLLDVVNSYTATLRGDTLRLESRPLPNPLYGKTVRLAGACHVDYSLETHGKGFFYRLHLNGSDGARENLGHVDSVEEAEILTAELNALLLQREPYNFPHGA
jgi:hypothetical protein